MHELAPGTVLHQRYRIVRPLGKGGMGAVYEAVDARLHNTVAVKQMIVAGEDADRAFEREARLLAALRHPALPVVIDYFVEDAGRFLVMQYIEGEDLGHVLSRQGRPFDAGELLRCAVALAGALAYLHRHDPPVVHRDLKPQNVNRTPAGEYVLLDFGLAKARDAEATAPAGEHSIYGFTPSYAPPEQMRGLPTDPRSDIFAFGATLYHLATAMTPPRALDRLERVAGRQPDPIRDGLNAAPDLDARMRFVIGRALALEPRDRFQSAGEILEALDGSGVLARPAPAPEIAPERRRVDAALPSCATVGRPVDLIVQVRFADSPSLGLEDWPSRRRPDRIEQASEPVDVAYPTDPGGGQLPARVRIRIVAADFGVAGASEQLIDVPPRDYSKRLAFLLTPLRAGLCRVNVEVYALDAAFLGMIAVEADAVDGAAAAAEVRVANLALRAHAQPARAADENTAALAPSIVAEARATAERARAGMPPRSAPRARGDDADGMVVASPAPAATVRIQPPRPAAPEPVASPAPAHAIAIDAPAPPPRGRWLVLAVVAALLLAAGLVWLRGCG